MVTHEAKNVCAYCGRANIKPEIEHVFPESWYPDGYPRTSMITVPSCSRCNRDFGRAEERLFLQFALSLPPSGATRSIVERAIRGADPDQGRGLRDTSHRAARKRGFNKRTSVVSAALPPSNAAWTPAPRPIGRVQTPSGLVVDGSIVYQPDPQSMDALTAKLLKGTFFHLQKRPLKSEAVISGGLFLDDPSDLLRGMLQTGWCHVRKESPFQYAMLLAPDDLTTSAMFVLWDFIFIGAGSLPPK